MWTSTFQMHSLTNNLSVVSFWCQLALGVWPVTVAAVTNSGCQLTWKNLLAKSTLNIHRFAPFCFIGAHVTPASAHVTPADAPSTSRNNRSVLQAAPTVSRQHGTVSQNPVSLEPHRTPFTSNIACTNNNLPLLSQISWWPFLPGKDDVTLFWLTTRYKSRI